MNPYQILANAIVELAVTDYKKALKYHYKHPGNKSYSSEVTSLEKFFHSGWYGLLTDLDGEWLMREIQTMVRKEVAA